MNIPNILTLLRIVAIPVFVLIYFINFKSHIWGIETKNFLLCLIFAIAGISDWFDGYLARKLKVTSPFGAFLDPVADKLIVAAALILIVVDNPRWYNIICVIVIISREITISALREWMATLGKRNSVAVSWIGKWKTTFQMGSIGCLLFKQSVFHLPVYQIGEVMLVIATGLTLYSMIDYLILAYKSHQ